MKFKCTACGKILEYDGPIKLVKGREYIVSYCSKTGRDVKCYKVEREKYPKITRESSSNGQYMAFIKLKDVKGSSVRDTRTVWSCDELDLWVDYDKDEKPLGIQVIFNKGK